MALTNVIALLEGQAGEATRSTRSRRGQTTTSFSLSVDAAVPCESGNEVDEVSNSFTRAQARAQAHARAREGEIGGRTPSTSRTSSDAPPATVILLRHCRCVDCRKFSEWYGDYLCADGIGGTKVIWATGRRVCEPVPDAWHYCAGYHGPQISKDVWVWPRRSRHVCAGSTIAPEVEQGYDHAPVRRHVEDHQTGQGGQGCVGTPPTSVAEDRDGNSRESSFCFSPRRTQP